MTTELGSGAAFGFAASASPRTASTVLFELLAAKGGHLELVRTIVVDTINKLLAAGQPIGNAKSFLAKGDQYKAANKFKDAYNSYRQAYRTATGH